MRAREQTKVHATAWQWYEEGRCDEEGYEEGRGATKKGGHGTWYEEGRDVHTSWDPPEELSMMLERRDAGRASSASSSPARSIVQSAARPCSTSLATMGFVLSLATAVSRREDSPPMYLKTELTAWRTVEAGWAR